MLVGLRDVFYAIKTSARTRRTTTAGHATDSDGVIRRISAPRTVRLGASVRIAA
jgi:hypothetical protein